MAQVTFHLTSLEGLAIIVDEENNTVSIRMDRPDANVVTGVTFGKGQSIEELRRMSRELGVALEAMDMMLVFLE